MSNNMFTNQAAVKGGTALILGGLADRYFYGNDNMQSNAMFGAATAAGITIGGLIGNQLQSNFIPDSPGLYSGKLLSTRLIEVTSGIASTYVLNKFVLKNTYDGNSFMGKIGAVAAIDFGSEYISDYIVGNALGFLTQ